MAMFDSPNETPEENVEGKAKQIGISAASQIEDMRQTAKTRMEGHLQEAERFRVLSEAHQHASSLWRDIADSYPQKADAVPSETENPRKYEY